ncbi:serine hydrolase [Streptomyces sp. BBFR51]|uniref:serine hydrolase n=1 Tax=Streptomyces sp. BBFR51 TaxID=3372856 RepID=UPI0037DD9C8B
MAPLQHGIRTTTRRTPPFQIDSVTKLWTATPVTQLADEGLTGLDAPVRDRLPEFRIARAPGRPRSRRSRSPCPPGACPSPRSRPRPTAATSASSNPIGPPARPADRGEDVKRPKGRGTVSRPGRRSP